VGEASVASHDRAYGLLDALKGVLHWHLRSESFHNCCSRWGVRITEWSEDGKSREDEDKKERRH